MAKQLTYKQAQGVILDALEKWDWTVKRNLKVPHATDPYNRVRLYFKPQAIYFDKGSPFSLGAARSLHVDSRWLAIFHWTEIRDKLVKETDYYANLSLNPVSGVPGGGISECIEEMRTRPDVDDPGALCASIAQKRGEFGWRSLARRPQKKKSTERRKTLRSIMGKAVR